MAYTRKQVGYGSGAFNDDTGALLVDTASPGNAEVYLVEDGTANTELEVTHTPSGAEFFLTKLAVSISGADAAADAEILVTMTDGSTLYEVLKMWIGSGEARGTTKGMVAAPICIVPDGWVLSIVVGECGADCVATVTAGGYEQ